MKRRPPGLLALAALVLSGIPLSQAVQQDTVQRVGTAQPATHVPPVPAGVVDVSGDDIDPIEAAPRKRKHNGAKHQSPAEGQNPYVPNLSSETPVAPRKKTISSVVSDINHHDTILEDASALATFAPDQPSVVAPILPFNRADGLGSHLARSLNDWEVEDFVLLATVNGDLYATDRKSGKTRWHTQIDKPIVETKHHRLEISLFDDDFDDIDHYIWAIEPTGPGRIFLMVPGQAGFRPTTLTMKNLAEMPAHLDKDLSYTGRKESAILTLDAATGRVHGWYGSNDADEDFRQFAANSCERPDEFADSDACSMSGTITLGRTDYVVIIRRSDGPAIATLKYSEWAPNHADHQLELQNTQTRDNQYMTGKPDGQVYGMSYNDTTDNENPMVFRTSVSSPLARVFDIFRPSDAPTRSNPALMILPQPAPPFRDANEKLKRLTSVYLGQTEKGSWYALSGELYPLITRSGAALSQKEDGFWERQPRKLDVAQLRKSLAGRHTYGSIPKPRSGTGAGQVGGPNYPEILGLPGPETLPGEEIDNASTSTIAPNLGPAESPNVIEKMKEIPQAAADSFVDLFRNPLFILGVVAVLLVYRQNILRWYNEKKRDVKKREIPSLSRDSTGLSESELKIEDATTASAASKDVVPSIDDSTVAHPDSGLQDQAPELVSSTAHKVVAPGGGNSAPPESVTEVNESTDSGPTVKFAPLVETHEANKGSDEVSSELLASPEKKKKPAHRGRRGGKKHVKKNKQASSDADKESTPPTDTDANVDDAVRDAYKLGDTEKRLEPDYHTVATDPQDVSGPILRMGSMEVNEDQQLGTGSNGTVVFAGKWDGRDVAVKRMLIQFYDIASQETRLLRESDDHENVIRYYAQQQRDAFLYIALELCQASLAEVVEKPQHFRELAMAGERDLPGVLHQITNGLSHLHALRIVHRDLKPQNILVNMGKGGKPRLLVSDFGLCKKLEGGQSSFGATTAHAAGTSGWRAPELLLDDDARDTGTTLIDASSTHSGSGGLVSTDLLPNRRATRAIDIFSLGLVFYYVLTKGSHPFDCGDRYMREVNIRKNNFNLDALSALGDYAFEAKDLIRSMLNADPKHRPPALEVMAHPFFWSAKKRLNFLCDVSDHFEKEPRDPPSEELAHLESYAGEVCRGDFLKPLGSMFVESLGKQRKYTGTRMLDLLRALRNKRNHYEDMSETLKKAVGPLPEGYLSFWTTKFPNLLITCWTVVWAIRWDQTDRFRDYYQPNYS